MRSEVPKRKLNINKEPVRFILQNKIYTGHVSHSDTQYLGSLGEKRKNSRHRKEWFEGKHEGFSSDELFETCQAVREKMARTFKTDAVMQRVGVHDRVYCARCVAMKPQDLVDDRYGKMRAARSNRDNHGNYRCLARDRGYHQCPQCLIVDDLVDEQVLEALSNLTIPDGFRERVEASVRSRVENEAALKRMQELT